MPATTWQALISQTSDHDDLRRLAESALNRLLYCYAVPLYRRLADVGDGSAIWWLAELLVEQGDVLEAMEFLRVLADAGVPFAARRLVELLPYAR